MAKFRTLSEYVGGTSNWLLTGERGASPGPQQQPGAIPTPGPAGGGGAKTWRDQLGENIVRQESGGNPNAVSPKGASGTMQIMPDTARDPGFGVPDIFTLAKSMGRHVPDNSPATLQRLLFDDDVNRRFGNLYLDAMLERYPDPRHAAAAYNAGPGRVDDAGGVPNIAETQHYVNTVMPSEPGAERVAATVKQHELQERTAPGGPPPPKQYVLRPKQRENPWDTMIPSLPEGERPSLNALRGAGENTAAIAGGLVAFGLSTVPDMLGEVFGGGGVAWVDGSLKYMRQDEWEEYRNTKMDEGEYVDPVRFFEMASQRKFLGSQTPPVMEDLWNKFWNEGDILGTAAIGMELGVMSAPEMAAAIAAPGPYIASLAERIALERAQNDGRHTPSNADVAVALPTAVVIAKMEALAGKYTLGLAGKTTGRGLGKAALRIGGAAATEGGQEFVQEVGEYAASTVGTKKGFDTREALLSGFTGMVAGTAVGGGLRGVGEVGGYLAGQPQTDLLSDVDPAFPVNVPEAEAGVEQPEEDFAAAVAANKQRQAEARQRIMGDRAARTGQPDLFQDAEGPSGFGRRRGVPEARTLRRYNVEQLRRFSEQVGLPTEGTRRELLKQAIDYVSQPEAIPGLQEVGEAETLSDEDTTLLSTLEGTEYDLEEDRFRQQQNRVANEVLRAVEAIPQTLYGRQTTDPEEQRRQAQQRETLIADVKEALERLKGNKEALSALVELLEPLRQGAVARRGLAQKYEGASERALRAFLGSINFRGASKERLSQLYTETRNLLRREAEEGLSGERVADMEWRRNVSDALGTATAALSVVKDYWSSQTKEQLADWAERRADEHSQWAREKASGEDARARRVEEIREIATALETVAAPLIAAESMNTTRAQQKVGEFSDLMQRGEYEAAAKRWPTAYAMLYALDPKLAQSVRNAVYGLDYKGASAEAAQNARDFMASMEQAGHVPPAEDTEGPTPYKSRRRKDNPYQVLADTYDQTPPPSSADADVEGVEVANRQQELIAAIRSEIEPVTKMIEQVEEIRRTFDAMQVGETYKPLRGFTPEEQAEWDALREEGKAAKNIPDAERRATVEADIEDRMAEVAARPLVETLDTIDRTALETVLGEDGVAEYDRILNSGDRMARSRALQYLLRETPTLDKFMAEPAPLSTLDNLMRLEHTLNQDDVRELVQSSMVRTVPKRVKEKIEGDLDPLNVPLRRAIEMLRTLEASGRRKAALEGRKKITVGMVVNGLNDIDVAAAPLAEVERANNRVNRWVQKYKARVIADMREKRERLYRSPGFAERAARTERMRQEGEPASVAPRQTPRRDTTVVRTFSAAIEGDPRFSELDEESQNDLRELAEYVDDQIVRGPPMAGKRSIPITLGRLRELATQKVTEDASAADNWEDMSEAAQNRLVRTYTELLVEDMRDVVARANATLRVEDAKGRGAETKAAEKAAEAELKLVAERELVERKQRLREASKRGKAARSEVEQRMKEEQEQREAAQSIRGTVPTVMTGRGRSRRPIPDRRAPRRFPAQSRPTADERRRFRTALIHERIGNALDDVKSPAFVALAPKLGVSLELMTPADWQSGRLLPEHEHLVPKPVATKIENETVASLRAKARTLNKTLEKATGMKIKLGQKKADLYDDVARMQPAVQSYYQMMAAPPRETGWIKPRAERTQDVITRISEVDTATKRAYQRHILEPLLNAQSAADVNAVLKRIEELGLMDPGMNVVSNALWETLLDAVGSNSRNTKAKTNSKTRARELGVRFRKRIDAIGMSVLEYQGMVDAQSRAEAAEQIMGLSKKRKKAEEQLSATGLSEAQIEAQAREELDEAETQSLDEAAREEAASERRSARLSDEAPDEYDLRWPASKGHEGADRRLQAALSASDGREITVTQALEFLADTVPARLRPIVARLARENIRATVQVRSGMQQAGRYSNGVITIDSTAGIHALLHEIIHAATVQTIGANPVMRSRLEKMMQRVRDAGYQDEYGLLSPEEFVAEGFSNVGFQRVLESVPSQQQSMWNRFLDFVRSALRLPAPRSVMDELMDMQNALIAEPGSTRIPEGAYNLIAEQGGPAMARAAASVHRHVATAGMAMRGRGWELAIQTLRQMARRYEDRFRDTDGQSLLRDYIDQLSKKWRKAHQHLQRSKDLLANYQGYVAKSGDKGRALNEAMTYATLYGVDPSKAAADQPKKNFNKYAFDEARKLFARLDLAGQKVFTDTRDFFEDEWNRAMDALIANSLIKRGIDMTPAQARKLVGNMLAEKDPAKREQLRDTAMNEMRLSSENLEYAGSAIDYVVEAMQSKAYQGLYFPIRRRGEYVSEWRGRFSMQNLDGDKLDQMLAEDPTLVVSKKAKVKGTDNTWDVQLSPRIVEFSETAEAAARSKAAGDRAWAEVQRKYPGVTTEQKGTITQLRHYNFHPGDSASRLLDQIQRRVDAKEIDRKQYEAIREAMFSMMPGTSIHAAHMRRENIRALNTDMLQSFAAQAQASAYWLAQLEEGMETGRALQRLDDFLREKAKTGDREELVFEGRLIDFLREKDDLESQIYKPNMFVRNIMNLGTANYLFSVSYSMINATQPFIVGAPYLIGKYGSRRATIAMREAVATLSPTLVESITALKGGAAMIGAGEHGRSKLFDSVADRAVARLKQEWGRNPARAKLLPELLEIIQFAEDVGIIDFTHAMDTRRAAEGVKPGSAEGAVALAMDIGRAMPHAVEVQNRLTMLVSTYLLAKSQDSNKSMKDLQREIVDAIEITQIDYSVWNEPRLFSPKNKVLGPVAPMVTMFLKYSQGISSLFVDAYGQIKDPKTRAQGLKTTAGLLATHTLAGGIAGGIMVQPLRLAFAALGVLFGDSDDPDEFWDDIEGYTDNLLSANFGPDMSEVMMYGLPRAAGIDVSSRISLSNLFGGYYTPKRTTEDTAVSWAFAQLGPVAAMFMQPFKAWDKWNSGDTLGAAAQMPMPKIIRDFLGAADLSQRGLETRAGLPIRSSDYFSDWSLFVKAMGFTPAEAARAYERRSRVLGIQTNVESRASSLRRRWVNAASAEERSMVMAEIREFNRTNGYVRVTPDQLRALAVQRRKAEIMNKRGYVSRTSREARVFERGQEF